MSQILQESGVVIENTALFDSLYRMRILAPSIASEVQPGQFVHVRLHTMPDHLLRRPYSLCDWDESSGMLTIIYQDVGYGSHCLSLSQPQEPIDLIGPVGTPWLSTLPDASPSSLQSTLLVGGGVGAAPLYGLAKTLSSHDIPVDVVLGAQTKDALVLLEAYEELLGKRPECATDDGTFGSAGFATVPYENRMAQGSTLTGAPYDYVAVCGPPPLMRRVATVAQTANIPCEVSLEKRMACGIGACLSCVCKDKDGVHKRVCVDGPVFDAKEISW